MDKLIAQVQGIRFQRGMTLRGVSAECGISFSQLAKYEREDIVPTARTRAKLMAWLDGKGQPDLAAMKRAFVEAWPWLEDAIRLGKQGRTTSLWGQHVRTAEDLPDEPFIAALRAAQGEPVPAHPGNYKAARGVLPLPEGAEKPEVTIRRMRDAWGKKP